MIALIIAASLGGASLGLIFLIVALVLLFIAAFIANSVSNPPWTRINFLAAGLFFYVLAVAVG